MLPRVVVACASGVATSRTVAVKIARLLAAQGVEADVDAVDIESLPQELQNAVAYVSVVRTEEESPVPVINGVAFLTGMNQDAELARLVALINEV